MSEKSGRIERRKFIGVSAAAGMSASLASAQVKTDSANNKIVVGVMGMGGRGTSLAHSFEGFQDVEVAVVCDVDEGRVGKAAKAVGEKNGREIAAVTDFRKILVDEDIDVLVIATCNHWHAPAAVMGLNAGKHVYVEKPATHNPHEGELLIEAAAKNKRLLQHGTQRRSWPKIMEGIQAVKDGAIGRAYYAQCYYQNKRPSIGTGKLVNPPQGLNYDLWQGPAPRRPFKDNILHYNWHWFWHWGNGELGNNGVHFLDVARWGLEVDYPNRVHCAGQRYVYDDDQETPDTSMVTYEFPEEKMITWQATSCSPFELAEPGTFVTFTGTEGTLAIVGGGYVVYDGGGKEVKRVKGSGGNDEHIGNFLDGIRKGTPLNADVQTAHVSALLCHLGNASHRVDRMLKCDPDKGGRILEDEQAMKFWKRDYETGWEPVA